MQSAFLKLLCFWSSVAPRLISASGEDVWQGLGIDFGKGSVHIPKYVTDKLTGNQSQPSSLLVYVAQAPCTKPQPKFKFHMGNGCHSTCLALVFKRMSTDKSAHVCSSFGSIFIWTFIPQAHTETPCARLGGIETWSL